MIDLQSPELLFAPKTPTNDFIQEESGYGERLKKGFDNLVNKAEDAIKDRNDKAREIADKAKQSVQNTANKAREAAEKAKDAAKNAAEKSKDKIQGATSNLKGRVSAIKENVADRRANRNQPLIDISEQVEADIAAAQEELDKEDKKTETTTEEVQENVINGVKKLTKQITGNDLPDDKVKKILIYGSLFLLIIILLFVSLVSPNKAKIKQKYISK